MALFELRSANILHNKELDIVKSSRTNLKTKENLEIEGSIRRVRAPIKLWEWSSCHHFKPVLGICSEVRQRGASLAKETCDDEALANETNEGDITIDNVAIACAVPFEIRLSCLKP